MVFYTQTSKDIRPEQEHFQYCFVHLDVSETANWYRQQIQVCAYGTPGCPSYPGISVSSRFQQSSKLGSSN